MVLITYSHCTDLPNSNSNSKKKSAGRPTPRVGSWDRSVRVRVRVPARLTALGPGRVGYGKAYPCMTLVQGGDRGDCSSFTELPNSRFVPEVK
jgi:hypothetical protein